MIMIIKHKVAGFSTNPAVTLWKRLPLDLHAMRLTCVDVFARSGMAGAPLRCPLSRAIPPASFQKANFADWSEAPR
jgi:hypothetical protein